ncbi:hypothetical protein [Tenacibaculum agarivorans]|uniref:hypothetical protein n=1 Tax=Tenacibaculum agarivorans TaxID=1908389 RepID=UPI00094BBDE9|nr:hypothetical protein [Tenacibaculum agarivorans]
MIQLVSRANLDTEKYNDCISQAIQSNIFGYSWYLDTAADKWSVFVLNDYEAVMPIPWRKKLFIKYTYQPFWVLQLGIYSKEIEDENEFLIELFSEFKYVNLRMHFKNGFSMFHTYFKYMKMQSLQLSGNYEVVLANYRKDRKKDIRKSIKNDLLERWGDDPETLINLFKGNVGRRTKKIKEKDYIILEKLMYKCITRNKGEVLSIYDKENKPVASGFFLKHNEEVMILVSSTNFKNRKNGANTFLIDRAIFKYIKNYKQFNFGGSIIRSIAQFFKSFGAVDSEYIQLHYNTLPKLIRFLKK